MIGELIELDDLGRRVFGLIRREAERWDGARPSRHLLAAADWGPRPPSPAPRPRTASGGKRGRGADQSE